MSVKELFHVLWPKSTYYGLLDRTHGSREYIASPSIFEHSVNILPVSRRLRPKTDIKELMEKQEIIDHHGRRQAGGADEIEQIYREVMIDVDKCDTTEVIKKTPPELLIRNIQGTALSNFYALPIAYKDVIYPSVEHAYQHQKFTPGMLRAVDHKTIEEIREAMRLRGYAAEIQDLTALFTDDRFNAGNIKIVADVLRQNGYGKEGWAHARVKTMIELLLIKFSEEAMGNVFWLLKRKRSLKATTGMTHCGDIAPEGAGIFWAES